MNQRLALVLGGALALLFAGCEASDADSSVEVSLTDDGCSPNSLDVSPGVVSFRISNESSDKVTAVRIERDGKPVAVKSDIRPGKTAKLSVTLAEGNYDLLCPGGPNSRSGTISVSDGASAAPEDSPEAKAAVERYRSYVLSQATVLQAATAQFGAAIRAKDIEAARLRFAAARAPYERIEPIVEALGATDLMVDGREDDVAAADWQGFHRLEKQIFEANSLDGAAELVGDLQATIDTIPAAVQQLPLRAFQVAGGAEELLNEISATKLTGEEDRYSHTDISDIAANVEGVRQALVALHPLLTSDSDYAKTLDSRLAAVDATLEPYRRGDGWALFIEVPATDIRKIAVAVDALAEPLGRIYPFVT